MAKKDKKKSSKKDKGGPADAVRGAVEQAFAATAGSAASTRDRAQELVDEIASAAARVRETLDDLKVLEDLKGLRTEVESLARRVAALETQVAEPPKPAAKPRASTARKAPARSTATRAAAAKRTSAARASAGTKPAGTRASGTRATRSGSASTRTRAKRTPSTETADDASSGRS